MDWLEPLQWPAMAVTVLATWMVGCRSAGKRKLGFWVFLLSNLMWAGWGLHTGAWALVVLQGALAVLNVRGQAEARKVRRAGGTREPDGQAASQSASQSTSQSASNEGSAG